MTTYNMLYVGKLYSIARFEAEAEKHGVSRALPAPVVGTLAWGDSIMLAQWQPDHEAQKASRAMQMTVEGGEGHITFKRIGSAKVFGYVGVTGLNMDAPPEAKAALASKLKIVRTVEYEPGGMQVSRECGSYGIGATHYVADTIAEIIEKAKDIEKEMGVTFKWFVAGRYVRIDDPVVLDPCKFTRGVLKVDVDGDLLSGGDFEPSINFIDGYKRQRYARKEEKQ